MSQLTICANAEIDLLAERVLLECFSDTEDGIWRSFLDTGPGRRLRNSDNLGEGVAVVGGSTSRGSNGQHIESKDREPRTEQRWEKKTDLSLMKLIVVMQLAVAPVQATCKINSKLSGI